MILEVLQYPDPKLRLKAQPVTNFDDALSALIGSLFESMTHYEGCGLAATQVNIQQRLFVMDVSAEQNEPLCLINPKIIHAEGEALSSEGCLSLPGISAKVKRHTKIITEFFNEKGEPQTRTSTDFEAFCIQHELDHLDGMVYIDRLSPLKRAIMLKKFQKLQKAD